MVPPRFTRFLFLASGACYRGLAASAFAPIRGWLVLPGTREGLRQSIASALAPCRGSLCTIWSGYSSPSSCWIRLYARIYLFARHTAANPVRNVPVHHWTSGAEQRVLLHAPSLLPAVPGRVHDRLGKLLAYASPVLVSAVAFYLNIERHILAGLTAGSVTG